jgi:hypothetical protein
MTDTFYVWRRRHGHPDTMIPGTRKKLPRYRHPSLESAQTEAERLSAAHPDSRFLVVQVVAEVGPVAVAEDVAA